MILLNLVLLSPIATSMVEDAVEDNFETYPYDTACADSDCTTVINVRVETSMITKKSKKDDRTAGYEFIAYGTAIKYVRS